MGHQLCSCILHPTVFSCAEIFPMSSDTEGKNSSLVKKEESRVTKQLREDWNPKYFKQRYLRDLTWIPSLSPCSVYAGLSHFSLCLMSAIWIGDPPSTHYLCCGAEVSQLTRVSSLKRCLNFLRPVTWRWLHTTHGLWIKDNVFWSIQFIY